MKKIGLSSLLILAMAPWTLAEEPAKNDMNALKGTWQLEQRTVNGKVMASAETAKEVTLTIDENGNWKAHMKGNEVLQGTLKIVSDKPPRAADWTVTTTGDKEGKVGLGIYEVDGDTFKLCYAPPEKERPTKFESTQGSLLTFSTFKRVKK